jgi:hypothetical protein
MEEQEVRRTIHGYTRKGKRVFLGSFIMKDSDVTYLNALAYRFYSEGFKSGAFTLSSSTFSFKNFSGIQILPPIKPKV